MLRRKIGGNERAIGWFNHSPLDGESHTEPVP